MTPPISVITPSYNQGRFIERTILSVLSQDVPGLEYLVFDGKSADETLDVLRRYEGRLRWTSEKDRGQTHAVNKGLAAARGEVIGWLNSDDVYYPGALRTILDFFAAHPDVDVVYGDADHINEEDGVIEPYYTQDWDAERLKDLCYICQPAVFFRRRVVERMGPLDESLVYCMDYEYWLRLASQGAVFARLPKALAGSRLHAETKTLGSRLKVHVEINDMLRRRFGSVPERWLSNYAHAVWDDRSLPRANRWFPAAVAVTWAWASIRWNRNVSRELFKTTFRWVGASLKGGRR